MKAPALGWPLRAALAGLHAYQAEPPVGDVALDANENPYAPPAEWMQRVSARLQTLPFNRYPDPACSGIRQALSALHGVPAGSLLFGNGSDELIGLLLTAFGGPGATLMVPTPTFSMYKLCALAQGWDVIEEPLAQGWQVQEEPLGREFELTLSFVERARKEKPRLIFLASPNNPTGNAFDKGLIEALLQIEGVTLVLDEAYVEFGGHSWLKDAPAHGRVIVLRTFSKAWGLAGLRLGWLCAPAALVAELEKVRLPYNIGNVTQALAEEALALSEKFLGRVPGLLEGRERLKAALQGLQGAHVFHSDANFILFRHADAGRLQVQLLSKGLRARRFEKAPLNDCIRLSVGTPAQMDRVEAALKEYP